LAAHGQPRYFGHLVKLAAIASDISDFVRIDKVVLSVQPTK